jgi:outer membrane protein assembly factor BamB
MTVATMHLLKTRSAILCCVAAAVSLGCSALQTGDTTVTYFNEQPADVILNEAQSQPRPRWKLRLDNALIESAQVINQHLIILGLRSYDASLLHLGYRVIDTERGEVLWTFSTPPAALHASVPIAGPDVVVVRTVTDAGTRYEARQTITGGLLWSQSFTADDASLIPLRGGDHLLLTRHAGTTASVAELDARSGNEGWRHDFALGDPPDGSGTLGRPTEEGIYLLGKRLTLLATASGEVIWQQEALADCSLVEPDPARGVLFALDKANRLFKIESGTGRVVWQVMLDSTADITHIAPDATHLFLRGEDSGFADARYFLVALDPASGKEAWRHHSSEPLLSNLLVHSGFLYAASPSSVVSLNETDGALGFHKKLSTADSLFPITLRRFGEKIVYVGELNVIALDARSGDVIYSRGFTPVSHEAELAALDAAVARENRRIRPAPSRNTGISYTALMHERARQYQAASNHFHRLADAKYYDSLVGRGSIYEARAARVSADLNATFSEVSNSIANMYMVMDNLERLENQYREMWDKAARELYEKRLVLRNSIINAYPMMQTRDYVYRPHRDLRSDGNGFIGVSVVHLPTGSVTHTNTSVPYRDYGLWTLVDPERGIVYQQGLGLDPNEFIFSTRNGEQAARSFFIAQPIELPR